MDNWQFLQDALGYWGWQHTAPDGALTLCSQRYVSRTDCIADAMRHGYLALGEPTPDAPFAATERPRGPDRSADAAEGC